jgi:phospholipid/cholesterol/gamma-HCH transport system ATP-binding protein
MIEVEDLHRAFHGQQVLEGVNLRVADGEVLALIGRSGYGKSVLLRHIMGLLRPDRGRVLIDGSDIHRVKSSQRRAIKDRFGVLFQGGALFDSSSVFENVAFPLREKTKMSESQIRERVMHELGEVDMVGAENKFPAEISGGMKKRVALARAIIQNPKIVFFDEPTTGLDPVTTRTIHRLIASTHRRLNFTAIIVTHEVPEIFSLVHRVALLHDRKIVAYGTPEQIMASEEPAVQEFFHKTADEAAEPIREEGAR